MHRATLCRRLSMSRLPCPRSSSLPDPAHKLWPPLQVSELISKHEAALGERKTEIEGLEAEVARLRKERQTMAVSLSQYATLEAEWGEAKEGREGEMSKLRRENRALKKKAAKLPALEKAVADSGHDEVVRLRSEAEQMETRCRLSETSMAMIAEENASLKAELKQLRAEGAASSWVAQEQLADTQSALQLQAQRIKEGLANRVIRMWLQHTLAKVWKAWAMYVMRRQIRRAALQGERHATVAPYNSHTRQYHRLPRPPASASRPRP